MEAIKIKCPVVGRIFKANEKAQFLAVKDYLRRANIECEIRYFMNGKEFASGLILAATQPRDEINIPFCMRFSNYELCELPRPLRLLIKQSDNAIKCTITRTPVGGTTYEARFDQGGFNISVVGASLSELKAKFIETAIAVEGV